MARKLWKVSVPAVPGWHERPGSKAAAYRWVRARRANWDFINYLYSPVVNVYVDERDGQGWQLYECIDLREVPDLD